MLIFQEVSERVCAGLFLRFYVRNQISHSVLARGIDGIFFQRKQNAQILTQILRVLRNIIFPEKPRDFYHLIVINQSFLSVNYLLFFVV